MNAHAFDNAVRSLNAGLPRRSLILPALHAALVLGGAGLPGGAAAKKKRKRKNKNKKIKRNSFGCVNVGMFCKNDEQCCSGICEGKKGKKTCRAHDVQGCEAGQNPCDEGESLLCTTSAGVAGGCITTTGNAGYCGVGLFCFVCTKDIDCEPLFGPGAACVDCSRCDEFGGTACVGLEAVS
jgi:hypothetical protein